MAIEQDDDIEESNQTDGEAGSLNDLMILAEHDNSKQSETFLEAYENWLAHATENNTRVLNKAREALVNYFVSIDVIDEDASLYYLADTNDEGGGICDDEINELDKQKPDSDYDGNSDSGDDDDDD